MFDENEKQVGEQNELENLAALFHSDRHQTQNDELTISASFLFSVGSCASERICQTITLLRHSFSQRDVWNEASPVCPNTGVLGAETRTL